jgi:outer membrane immunogenic protein
MGPVMRRLVAAIALIAFGTGGWATGAWAADYEPSDFPTLRGSTPYVPAVPTYTRWNGLYAGGQAGFGVSGMDLGRVTAYGPTDPFLTPLGLASAWALFGTDHPKAGNFGAFVGYVSQWDDIVLGVELNYNRTRLLGSSSALRSFTGVALPSGSPNTYDGTILATSSVKITDYGTVRLRGGWAYENFLPYAMVGLAVGWAQTTRSATVSGTPSSGSPGGAPFVTTNSTEGLPILWGYSAGIGTDILVTSNVFLRAEYEFVQFLTASNVRANVNAVRGGLGLRF